MADPDRQGAVGGITLGGIIVIVGIVLIIVWSFWIGLIVALVGLIAFRRVRARKVVLAAGALGAPVRARIRASCFTSVRSGHALRPARRRW